MTSFESIITEQANGKVNITSKDISQDMVNSPASGSESIKNNNGSSSHIKKISIQAVDITKTRQYKEIYADNLRQYGFLLAKQLGISNQNTIELRKQYLLSRHKESQRRAVACQKRTEDKKEGLEETHNRFLKKRVTLSTLTQLNLNKYIFRNGSCPNLQSPEDEKQKFYDDERNEDEDTKNQFTKSAINSPIYWRKTIGSLTDIRDINDNDCQRKLITAVKKRKSRAENKQYFSKRLSQPDITVDLRIKETIARNESNRAQSLNNLSLLNDEKNLIIEKKNPTSLADCISQRQREAKERYHWRLSRLESFDGILTKASSFINERKKSLCPNSTTDLN